MVALSANRFGLSKNTTLSFIAMSEAALLICAGFAELACLEDGGTDTERRMCLSNELLLECFKPPRSNPKVEVRSREEGLVVTKGC